MTTTEEPDGSCGKTILITDDDSAVVATLKEFFEHAGYNVLTAGTGCQCIDIATESVPDAIIMDQKMPGMTGVETLAKMRENEKLKDIPVVFLSALDYAEFNSESGFRDNAFEVGAYDIIQKPAKLGVLGQKIERFIALSEDKIRLEDLYEKLKQSEEAYRSLFVNAPSFITIVNRTLKVQSVNYAVLGMNVDDVVGKDVRDFVDARYHDILTRAVGDVFATGEIREFESLAVGPDGTEAWYENRLSPIKKGDEIVEVTIFGNDITKRKHAEEHREELREKLICMERMESLGVLAGGVAHDLNNVLGPMVTLPDIIADDLQLLADGDDVNIEDIVDALNVIKTSAGRAALTVRDLVSLSRRGRYDFVPLDLNRIACVTPDGSSVTDMKRLYSGLAVSCKTGRKALAILGDESHLARAIHNVVHNAAEAVGEKGKVTIKTFEKSVSEVFRGYEDIPPGSYGVIQISDTGVGIAPNHLGHIFEPFFTRKVKTDRSGSGLGLSIVNGIVKDHNGFVNVESEEGKGTVFTLYFPLVSDVIGKGPTPEDTPIERGTERILVVDDEPGQRFLGRISLNRLGYLVTDVQDGREAVKLFMEAKEAGEDSPFDLLILDMIMEEGFDGLTTYEKIIKLYPGQKVIIASGHAEDGRARAAEDLGAVWLAKPYELNVLARLVRKVLDG